jgi:hypothetical protein
MRAWMVYKNIPNLRPIFYAFTDNKQLVKRFKYERKNELFTIVEHEISTHEYNKFIDERYKYRLVLSNFITRNDHLSTVHVELVVPETEILEVYLRGEEITKELEKYTSNISSCFSDDLKDNLGEIGYFSAVRFHSAPEYFRESLTVTDMFYNDFKVDELGLWLYFNSSTLNEKHF